MKHVKSILAAMIMAAAGTTAFAEDVFISRKVVATGDVMPNGGAISYITGWPVINDKGDVGFVVMTEKKQPRLEFGTLMCVQDAKLKIRVALQKEMNLGGADKVDGMSSLVLSDDGFIAAKVSMAGSNAKALAAGGGFGAILNVSSAIVRVSPDGKAAVIAKAGAPAAGVEGGTYLTLPNDPGLAQGGRMIFDGGIGENGKGTGGGLWRVEPDGAVKLIARKGTPLSNVKDGELGTLMTGHGLLASDGTTIFSAFLKPAEGETPTSRWGLWRAGGNGALRTMMFSWLSSPLGADKQGKKGDPGQVKSVTVNAKGEIATALTVLKSDIRAGILTVDMEENLRIVVTCETPAPDGLRFNDFDSLVINNNGKVAFTSFVFGPKYDGGRAIFAEDNAGKLHMIARPGDPAPGADGGKFKFLDVPQFCATGQVAFCALLEDGKKGLWMTDTSGTLRLIALAGKMTEPGKPNKTIKDVSIASIAGATQSGGGDGRPRALNNDGVLVYYCQFEDLTGRISAGAFAPGK